MYVKRKGIWVEVCNGVKVREVDYGRKAF